MPHDELLIYDQREPCPYLPGQIARLPLRLPAEPLTGAQLDERLAAGDRRSGQYLYGTRCPGCQACEPLRIEVGRFVASSSQRRVLRRGDRWLAMRVEQPVVDRQRVRLFNTHRRQRGLTAGQSDVDHWQYTAFLVHSCCDTLEISYWLDQQLVAVAISDRGCQSLSAVYCYFDPAYSRFSPGAYSILKQIELCHQWGIKWLYLGFYIGQSPHMNYKAQYLPHQRLIGGGWQTFDRAAMGMPD